VIAAFIRVIRRVLGEPLVHFFVLAVALLAVQQRFLQPEPRQRIVVSPEVVRGLRQDFVRRTGAEPSPAEAAALLERYLDNEVLYREALAQGLDRGDIIVRRRLIQKMEFVLEASEPIANPSDAELQQYLDTHAERYATRARVSLAHVFVSTDRHGDAAESQAAALQAQLAAGADPAPLGDPFLRGREFKLYTEAELAGIFGAAFVQAVMPLPVGAWSRPLRSSFGWHVVRLDQRTPGRVPEVREVRDSVLRDWLEERRTAAGRSALQRLRATYDIDVRVPDRPDPFSRTPGSSEPDQPPLSRSTRGREGLG